MSIRSSILRWGVCVFLLTSAVTFQAASRQTRQEASVEQLSQSIARIKKTFGVQVHYSYDRNTYFADDWREAPVKAEGKQIDLGEASRTLPIVEAFLAGYPKAVLAENLRDVFLVRSMSFYGQEFGGTSSADGIYITNDGEDEGYTRQYLESTMHDEFSSILFRNYDFPEAEWSQINERGWNYVGYGKDFDVLCRTDLFDSSEALLSKGFLNTYAQVSIEEDFNTYISTLIEKRPWLMLAASRHKRVWQKLQIVINFYKKIDVRCYLARELEIRPAFIVDNATADPVDNQLRDGVRDGELPHEVFAPTP